MSQLRCSVFTLLYSYFLVKQKLKAIEKLKEQKAGGKVLEANQLEKIQGEHALVKELQQLELNG